MSYTMTKIDAKNVAAFLEDKLNASVRNYGLDGTPSAGQYAANAILKNTKFLFNLTADTADFKQSVRSGNTVTHYINGIMTQTDSAVSGFDGSKNIYMAFSCEFLVPFTDIHNADGDSATLLAVRDLMTDAFSALQATDIITIGTDAYVFGSSYELPTVSTRDIRDMVGDSVPVLLFFSVWFVQAGVASDKIVMEYQLFDGKGTALSVGAYHILPEKFGFHRVSVQESIIPSDSSAPNALALVSSTALTFTFSSPLRGSELDAEIKTWLLRGEMRTTGENTSPNTMKCNFKIPHGTNAQGTTIYIESGERKFTFSDIGVNGEKNMAASVDVTLVEVF